MNKLSQLALMPDHHLFDEKKVFKKNVVQSVSENQDEIISGIMRLHCPNGFECDLTYGNGVFYKNLPKPRLRFDIDPQKKGVIKACSQNLPIQSASIQSVMFDPPFLTYVSFGRNGNGSMVMARRFGGYWSYDELENHYRGTISEAYRILKNKGVFVVKCQDIIHNHQLFCTHANVIHWSEIEGFKLDDLYILSAKRRLPTMLQNARQKHARIFHSFFLVFKKRISARLIGDTRKCITGTNGKC